MAAECCKQTWGKVPEDEPVFIIRGKDALALGVVSEWIDTAKLAGVNADKIEGALRHRDAIRKFQQEHPDRVKLPD